MSMTKSLGGDRLGSGKKQNVELHGYERSTHDLGYLWRSTMSAGTLVPFMSEVALPGDTFDIDLEADIKTHPTIGPLFGSYKVQLDIFQAPVRLYQGALHNNKLGIGMNMASVKLPQMQLLAMAPDELATTDLDNSQINPSCILSYLGIRGVGSVISGDVSKIRDFNAIPFLAYWEIYKNYYANKQEEIGAVIHNPIPVTPVETIDDIEWATDGDNDNIANYPAYGVSPFNQTTIVNANYTGAPPIPETILVTTVGGITYRLIDLFYNNEDTGPSWRFENYRMAQFGALQIANWRYITAADQPQTAPAVSTFDLNNIDEMRENILAQAGSPTAFSVNLQALQPYEWVTGDEDGLLSSKLYNQEGLGLKTYQSDLFNNWLSTEWIDGPGGINDITAVDTSGGSFNIDALLLSKKVYDMLNRIAVSGGTYDDWLDAVYTHERVQRAESPIYHGGLIRELVFQEVVSNSENATESQPLGTLAGKGIMAQKKKGGQVTIKVDEPSYIIGIVSLTPRIDYSQGNKWDTHLTTMDDFHKPALDEIGFQELITEQMAWWSTTQTTPAGDWGTVSAGKQPAWINYMTNVNQTRGNFAVKDNEMFMTLNRRYEADPGNNTITDLTTYIDPKKFNFIFAQTALDAQNFWAQISVDITARRKMSAKVMPNL